VSCSNRREGGKPSPAKGREGILEYIDMHFFSRKTEEEGGENHLYEEA
jgi:hypothetical protein